MRDSVFEPGICCERASNFLLHYGRYQPGAGNLAIDRAGKEVLVDHHALLAFYIIDSVCAKQDLKLVATPCVPLSDKFAVNEILVRVENNALLAEAQKFKINYAPVRPNLYLLLHLFRTYKRKFFS